MSDAADSTAHPSLRAPLWLLVLITPQALLAITVTMTFGAGLASPAALSSALAVFPSLTGSAAGFYGFTQMAVGALGTLLVGFGDDPVRSCALTQICLTALAVSSFGLARFHTRRAAPTSSSEGRTG